MALTSIKGTVSYPHRPLQSTVNALAIAAQLLDAASEKSASIFQIPKTGNVRKIVFRTSTVTNGATVDVRLETVDLTTGDPSGTLVGANTNASQVIANTDDNTVFTVQLTADAAVTQGQIVAVVIVNPAVSPGNLNISVGGAQITYDYPYTDLFTASWAKAGNNPLIALEYDDTSYAVIQGVIPYSAVTNTTFNNGSTPDERGNIFQVPVPCRAIGAWVWADLDGDFDLVLYDSDGSTQLCAYSGDLDTRFGTSHGRVEYLFNSATKTANLAKDTSYRIVLKPTTTTSVISQEFSVNSASIMDALIGGQNIHLTTRTDAGAWSQTTTSRMMIGILIDAFDNGVGGASGMRSDRGMVGGMLG